MTTFVTFRTDGKRHESWYDSDEKIEDNTGLITWQQLKPYVFDWIKGKKTPQKVKIDFCHYMANGDVGSMRIQFESQKLHVFTGYMQREFSMDKSQQQMWDDNCEKFIQKNKIVSTRIE